jgi:predicted exporter
MPESNKKIFTRKKMPESNRKNNPSVFFVDKMHSVGEALTKLSHIALGLIALIYVLVFLLLSYIYNLKASFKIIMTPVSACILSTATLGILNVPFNFFAIVGLILTLSIGIDYALFFKERYKTIRNTMLGVLLCFITTVLSFGFLSLSSFAPVS